MGSQTDRFTWGDNHEPAERPEQDKKITLKEIIVEFPRHLKLHLSEIDDLINNKT
jgi:hypothetical protein